MKGKTSPLVSIVSVFYNRAYCVEYSVQSLLDQDYGNFEIVLVDDGSSDNTYNELRRFRSENVKVITHQNMGFTKSMKRAIALSSGDYIAIHGSGDYSHSTRISSQLKFLEANREVGAVGCGREIYCEKTKRVSYNIKNLTLGKFELVNQQDNIFSQGEVMLKRSVYDAVDGYRDIFTYTQDFDLWLRINEISKLSAFPEVLYREYGRLDGVRHNLCKVVSQKKFAEVARISAESRIKTGNDVLDRVCRDSVFDIIGKSKRMSGRFCRLALVELALGDKVAANVFLKEARGYYVSPAYLMLRVFLSTPFSGRVFYLAGCFYKVLKRTATSKSIRH